VGISIFRGRLGAGVGNDLTGFFCARLNVEFLKSGITVFGQPLSLKTECKGWELEYQTVNGGCHRGWDKAGGIFMNFRHEVRGEQRKVVGEPASSWRLAETATVNDK